MNLAVALVTVASVVAVTYAKVCPAGYTSVDFGTKGGSCYKMPEPKRKMTFDQAKAVCTAEGATLISADTLKEFVAVTDWLKTEVHPSNDIWVDLVYLRRDPALFGTERNYRWLDGTPSHPKMWMKNEPSASTTRYGDPLRVVIWTSRSRGFLLDNRSPNRNASYVCEKQKILDCEDVGCWSEGVREACTPAVMRSGLRQDYSVVMKTEFSIDTCEPGSTFGLSEDMSTVYVDSGCKGVFTICADDLCPNNEIHCRDLETCIPPDWTCDGYKDCEDNSDEDTKSCDE